MNRSVVGPLSQVAATMHAMQGPGALLCSVAPDGRPNVMTIGWCTLGIIWGRPMCLVLVRPERFTFDCLEATGDFTIGVFGDDRRDDLLFCGTESGRRVDKLAHCGLTPVPSQHVRSPLLDEALVTYECRVVHRHDLLPDNLAPELLSSYGDGHLHRTYYGHILAVTAAV